MHALAIGTSAFRFFPSPIAASLWQTVGGVLITVTQIHRCNEMSEIPRHPTKQVSISSQILSPSRFPLSSLYLQDCIADKVLESSLVLNQILSDSNKNYSMVKNMEPVGIYILPQIPGYTVLVNFAGFQLVQLSRYIFSRVSIEKTGTRIIYRCYALSTPSFRSIEVWRWW